MPRPLVLQVPVPPNTARCFIHVGMGRAKYEPEQRAIVWRVKRMIGGSEGVFSAEVELTPSIREKAWSRPPIQVQSKDYLTSREMVWFNLTLL